MFNILTIDFLLKYFFEIHDFEQQNGQGPDIGKQYKSAIFCYDDKQVKIASNLIDTLSSYGYNVATNVRNIKPFYLAEEEHLDYYSKPASIPYCHSYKKIFKITE